MVELTPGQAFVGRYVCARKDRLTARNGSGYLSLELRDSSGTIPARIFRDVDQISLRFERGDVIKVKGKVERFNGYLKGNFLVPLAASLEGRVDALRVAPLGVERPTGGHGRLPLLGHQLDAWQPDRPARRLSQQQRRFQSN